MISAPDDNRPALSSGWLNGGALSGIELAGCEKRQRVVAEIELAIKTG